MYSSNKKRVRISFNAPATLAFVALCVIIQGVYTFTGSKMELNFSTSARGYVYVTVRACGQEARSCELFGDALDRAVPFEGDLAAMAVKKAEIEFTLRDADVFSYRFFD